MNETERQIVAWLRKMAKTHRSLAEMGLPSISIIVERHNADYADRTAGAIERGEHRDKQDV